MHTNEIPIFFNEYSLQLKNAMESVDTKELTEVIWQILRRIDMNGIIYTCGNGGSAAIANHLVCDCMKGVREGTKSKLMPRVISLASNVPLMTAIANDIGYEEVFSYQLESLALNSASDILVVISSSGNSQNILRALEIGNAIGMLTIAMVGFDGGKAAEMADFTLHVKSNNYGVIEDCHQSLMHIISQYLSGV